MKIVRVSVYLSAFICECLWVVHSELIFFQVGNDGKFLTQTKNKTAATASRIRVLQEKRCKDDVKPLVNANTPTCIRSVRKTNV